jgi:hypothetical protein
MALSFKEATDRLIERVTLVDIAGACGSHPNSIERARLQPGSKNYREPPPRWETAVMALARERIRDLQALMNSLEDQGVD